MDSNNLDVDISQLEIDEPEHNPKEPGDNIEEISTARKRSCRQKPKIEVVTSKKRVLSKPKRLSAISTEKDIVNYYLDKKIKTHNALETIFEEPTSDIVMTKRKLSRRMQFDVISPMKSKLKTKKRSMKAKKKKPAKLPMELLLKKLANMEG